MANGADELDSKYGGSNDRVIRIGKRLSAPDWSHCSFLDVGSYVIDHP